MNTFDYRAMVLDPAVFAVNRLPAHSDHVAYAGAAELAAGESSLRFPLDGIWRFRYAKNPASAADGFWAADYDLRGWDSIRVPAHIQLEGWDKPAYLNYQYPWDASERLEPGAVPEIFNPVADYALDFTLPAAFEGEKVHLCFDGVESGFACWLNGSFVGYSEDSFDPSEFDLSEFLRPGPNRLAVRVFKWTPGSWFEDQDFFRFSGIFRSVYLTRIPEAAVLDISAVPLVSEDFEEGRVEFKARVHGSGSLRLTLLDGKQFAAWAECIFSHSHDAAALLLLKSPHLWSAEIPALYTLRVEVFDPAGNLTELIEQPLGFRRFELKDGLMLLNGRRIVFRGVNRHDFSSLSGRVPNREELLHDLRLMKQHNINALRTCHYPDNSLLYTLCDELGLYVLDETNMETHGSWDAVMRGQDSADCALPKDHEEFAPLLLDRVESIYQRDKNHACVLIWSCGNESYGGRVIHEMSRRFHALDPHRLVHYEGIFHDRSYPDTSDMESQMYTPAAEIERFLKEHPEKPFLCCEYTHAMGNSCGAMHKYTELTDLEPRYQGGFIWDWADQSLWQKNRYGEDYLAYGGDFGERPCDYNFSGNGIVYGGDHSPSPKLQEVKFNYQTLSLRFTGKGFKLFNKNLFLDAEVYRCEAILLQEGAELDREEIAVSVPPQGERVYAIPERLFALMAQREQAARALGRDLPEFAVTVSFTLRERCAWAEAGHEVAFGQTVFKRSPSPVRCTEPLRVVRGRYNLGVFGRNFSAQFSALRPGLTSYVYGGVEYIKEIPSPNFWRAPVDNDRANLMPQRCGQWKLASLYPTPMAPDMPAFPEYEERENSVAVFFTYHLPTNPPASCCVCYEVFGDGTVETSLCYKAVPGLCEMPEFGMLFRLDASLDRVIWYGLGPEETYADRQRGGRLGVWEKSVKENMARYLMPQESGNKCAVRWAKLVDRRGRGLCFSGDEMSLSVSPYTPHELENARHAYELPPVHYTVVRPALMQMGVGGDDTWGARVHPEYLLPKEKDLRFTFRFKGI